MGMSPTESLRRCEGGVNEVTPIQDFILSEGEKAVRLPRI